MLHSALRAKRATFTIWVNWKMKMPKMVNLATFWNPETCGQTVLPDRPLLVETNWRKLQKFKCDILGDFHTLWYAQKKFHCVWKLLKKGLIFHKIKSRNFLKIILPNFT